MCASTLTGTGYLIVNVQVPPEAAKNLRGQRVKVGCWFRLGGGSLVPGLNLRQSGNGEYLGGIYTLQAKTGAPPQAAQRQIILAQSPFDWPAP